MGKYELITAEELGERLRYNPRYILRQLLDYKLFEGVHYVRPFGGKKILFIWERVFQDLNIVDDNVPLAAGGTING
jgi:hypothetical protein